MKKVLKWVAVAFLSVAGVAAYLYFAYLAPFKKRMNQIEIALLGKSTTVITGGGGNSGIVVSDSLVMVIDTKMDDKAKLLREKVIRMAGNKPLLVVNTHWHPDHIGGNKFYKANTILAGDYGKEAWINEAGEETLPSKWLKGRIIVPMGEDTALIFRMRKTAHTPADIMVYMKQSKILFAGDVILNKQAPVLMGEAKAEVYVENMMRSFRNSISRPLFPVTGP